MIYLDTHVVSWLYAGEVGRLSKAAAKLVDSGNDLLISPMVALELQYLFDLNRVSKPARQVLAYLEEQIGLTQCRRPFAEVIESSLKQSWTRDPFDRIIVGQASLGNDVLLTQDQTIRKNYRKAVW